MNSIDSQIPQMPEVRIARLEDELDDLREENARLRAEVARLEGQLAPAHASGLTLLAEKNAAEARLARVVEAGDQIVARNCGDAEVALWAAAKEE